MHIRKMRAAPHGLGRLLPVSELEKYIPQQPKRRGVNLRLVDRSRDTVSLCNELEGLLRDALSQMALGEQHKSIYFAHMIAKLASNAQHSRGDLHSFRITTGAVQSASQRIERPEVIRARPP